MTAAGAAPIVGVVGSGVTGSRTVAKLAAHDVQVAVHDPQRSLIARRPGVVAVDRVDDLAVTDVVVLCQPGPHAAVAEHLLRQRQFGGHQERRPIDRVKPDDILADQMQVRRPPF